MFRSSGENTIYRETFALEIEAEFKKMAKKKKKFKKIEKQAAIGQGEMKTRRKGPTFAQEIEDEFKKVSKEKQRLPAIAQGEIRRGEKAFISSRAKV